VACSFGESAEQFYLLLEMKQVDSLAIVRLKVANKQFSS
jgi:hypothetical protein